MYKYILESIDQINWLAIVPLIIFFAFFCVVIINVMREKKEHVERMGQMPLEND